jgi:hypothetical protein
VKSASGLALSGLVSLVWLTACTTTAPPSRLDAYLCGEAMVEVERGVVPPSAACIAVVKASRRWQRDWEMPRCGPDIDGGQAQMVALDDMAQVIEIEREGISGYRLAGDSWLAVESSGSNAATDKRIKRLAASAGCQVALLGPEVTAERRFQSRVSRTPYRLVRLATPFDQDTGRSRSNDSSVH